MRQPRWSTYEQGFRDGKRSARYGTVPEEAHVHSTEEWRRGYSDGYRWEDQFIQRDK